MPLGDGILCPNQSQQRHHIERVFCNRASLNGLRAEVAAAKSALQEAEAAEADAGQRAEAALQRVAELLASQEELRSKEDEDEQKIQVRSLA